MTTPFKTPLLCSDKELAEQLKQIVHWHELPKNVKNVLKTVSDRMEFAGPYKDPDFSIGIQDHPFFAFEIPHHQPFIGILEHNLKERHVSDGFTAKFIKEVATRLYEFPEGVWEGYGSYHAPSGIEITSVIFQCKEDFSDYRIICCGKLLERRMRVLMITPGDCYPISVYFEEGPRSLEPSDFFLWDYNEVYHELNVNTETSTSTAIVHRYNTGKLVRYSRKESV